MSASVGDASATDEMETWNPWNDGIRWNCHPAHGRLGLGEAETEGVAAVVWLGKVDAAGTELRGLADEVVPDAVGWPDVQAPAASATATNTPTMNLEWAGG